MLRMLHYEEDHAEYLLSHPEKIDWKSKFLQNCEEVVAEFEWASRLAEVVSCFDVPEDNKYSREIRNLLKEKCPVKET